MAEPILQLDRVTAGYGGTTVLQDVSLRIDRGARLAILGRNGVGKTTLLATIMGLTRLRSGTILHDGTPIERLPPHARAARGLGLVAQTRDIFASLSVEENLRAGLAGGASLDEAWALFPRLRERRRTGGGALSGGEQQMLAIARALARQPSLLLLDEPLEGLAPLLREQLMSTFATLAADRRRTLILVEQHADLALDFADRAVVLDAGAVVHDGPAGALRSDPATLDRLVGLGPPV